MAISTIGQNGLTVPLTSNTITSASATALTLQSAGTTAVTIDTSQNLQFNSGFGSVATAYGCRAWVNFNGSGTVAIRASGNVSSITDNGVGDYTVNFTNAMPDTNYSFGGFCVIPLSRSMQFGDNPNTYSTGSLRISTGAITAFGGETTKYDATIVNIQVFR